MKAPMTEDDLRMPRPGYFREIRIIIPTQQGDREVDAYEHPRIPGLLVTHFPFGRFAVTHSATGRLVSGGYERAGNALLGMVQLGLCIDWTSAAVKDLVAQFNGPRGAEPVPFEGATSTANGVVRPLTIMEFFQLVKATGHAGDEFPWEDAGDSPTQRALTLLDRHYAPEGTDQ